MKKVIIGATIATAVIAAFTGFLLLISPKIEKNNSIDEDEEEEDEVTKARNKILDDLEKEFGGE